METQTTDFLDEAIRCRLAGGIKDPEIVQQIQEKSREIRDRVSRTHGLLDVAVELVGESRDE